MERVALILAGFPATGKSHLLRHCLSAKVPLFGKFSPYQAGFVPVPRVLDHYPRNPVGNQYAHHEWFIDLLKTGQSEMPRVALLHMDLANVVQLRQASNSYLTFLQPNHLAVRLEHSLSPLTDHFDKIVVNSVEVPLEELARRYLRRQHAWRINGWGDTHLDAIYRSIDVVTFRAVTQACNEYFARVSDYRLKTTWTTGFHFLVNEL